MKYDSAQGLHEIQRKVTRRTKATTTIELNQQNLLDLLKAAGLSLADGATATFTCPTGADCSGETFDLDEVHLVISWTRITEERNLS